MELGNLLGQETIKKIYEDAASEPIKEVSKIAVDIVKTFRLFTAPFQLGAAFQDRFTKYLDKVRSSVPIENQIEAAPSIAGPIIEKLKYLEDENYLIDLYLNLLTRSIDKERINEAHPAFKNIIDQLSPDEAMLLYYMGTKTIEYDYSQHLEEVNGTHIKLFGAKTKRRTIPNDLIFFETNFSMYISHLESLNLIYWGLKNESALYEDDVQTGILRETYIELTAFGKLFFKACIPTDGFNFSNKNPTSGQ